MKPVRFYLKITGLPLLLLVATVGAAFLDLGVFNTPVAMSISAIKAGLIVFFFMQLRTAPGLILLYALAGFFWVTLMMTLTFSDYLSR